MQPLKIVPAVDFTVYPEGSDSGDKDGRYMDKETMVH